MLHELSGSLVRQCPVEGLGNDCIHAAGSQKCGTFVGQGQ